MDKATPTKLNPLGDTEFEQQVLHWFSAIGEQHQGYAYIYMGTEQGGYTQWPTSEVEAHYDPRQRYWYSHALAVATKTHKISPKYYREDDIVTLATAHKFTNSLGERGVVAIDVSLNFLTDLIADIRIGETGYLMLVDREGVVLADPYFPSNNFKNIDSLQMGAEQFSELNDGMHQVILNNSQRYVLINTCNDFGWKYIAIIDHDEVHESANAILNLLFFVSALAIALLLGLMMWFSKILMVNKPNIEV
ncbi:cache domain-containing protein [Shewanella marina]|uniref:cache domain-containing protein n=1 Tax=Shewanella marina TaxID=487319 RepID=UPI000472F10C|nr:cache domain-containing protein [Shewanella marina]